MGQPYGVVGHGPVDVETTGPGDASPDGPVSAHRCVQDHGPRPARQRGEAVHVDERAGQAPRSGAGARRPVLGAGHERFPPGPDGCA